MMICCMWGSNTVADDFLNTVILAHAVSVVSSPLLADKKEVSW
jgi:hypothetical protein